MTIAPTSTMSTDELIDYIGLLEQENQALRKKTDNRRKLHDIEVRQIRTLAESGDWTQTEIANEYGVNPATVSRILNRRYHAAV